MNSDVTHERAAHGIGPGQRAWLTPSSGILFLANAIPLLGVALLGWDVFPIVFLYWLENVVVGAFNVLRLVSARPREVDHWVGKVFLVPFFVFHYGMFTMVHGVFVFNLFGRDRGFHGFFPSLEAIWSTVREYGLLWAVLALLLSHAFSYGWNYLGNGEFRTATLRTLMHQPYRRVVVLHVVILFGGFAVLALGEPIAALLLLVLLKTGIDWAAHLREHRGLQRGREAGARKLR